MAHHSQAQTAEPHQTFPAAGEPNFAQRLHDQLLASFWGGLDDLALPLVFTGRDKIEPIPAANAAQEPIFAFKATIAGIDFALCARSGTLADAIEAETAAVKKGSIDEVVLKCASIGKDDNGTRTLIVLAVYWLTR